jgi:hypothetical protein
MNPERRKFASEHMETVVFGIHGISNISYITAVFARYLRLKTLVMPREDNYTMGEA